MKTRAVVSLFCLPFLIVGGIVLTLEKKEMPIVSYMDPSKALSNEEESKEAIVKDLNNDNSFELDENNVSEKRTENQGQEKKLEEFNDLFSFKSQNGFIKYHKDIFPQKYIEKREDLFVENDKQISKNIGKSKEKNEDSTPEVKNEKDDKKGNEEIMTNKEFVFGSLPEAARNIQDNTITDTWGVILKLDQLPAELKEAKGYTITIDGQSYELTLNKYNSNVFNVQVPSTKHSIEDIKGGTVKKH